VIRDPEAGRGDCGRSPTFVPASDLYDAERGERIPFRWAAWQQSTEGGGTP
jgi:hypothetical protein